MTERNDDTISSALKRLVWPLRLTRAGMAAERAARAFWPLWSVLALALAGLMMGLQDSAPVEAVWAAIAGFAVAALWALVHGIRRFRMPTRAEALERLDGTLPGRPIQALNDSQAIGRADAASGRVWRAHQDRMAARAAEARAAPPDLRVSRRDPFALRYVALLALMVALLFGSFWRVGSVAGMAPGGAAMAAGPSWEGWVEPPGYTGKPSLYLADIPGTLRVPEGSLVTLRLYGQEGALSVTESVSGQPVPPEGGATGAAQSFDIVQNGEIGIAGPGGRSWQVEVEPDSSPVVQISAKIEREADGQMRQQFYARDDYEVVGGSATLVLDLDRVDRRYGLAAAPDPREPIELSLPMPITGDRSEFEEVLIENLSLHPWANLPVTLQMQVEDALGQTGDSKPFDIDLPGRRFFDPMAKAVIEQRQALLWARSNGPRVVQLLKAVSNRPEDAFRSETAYLRLRVTLRRLENFNRFGLSGEQQEEIAQALWDLAVLLEEGDLSNALERLRRAQERLSEAMRNGASNEEIAELMQELREAMQDYMRQLAQQQPQDGDQQQPQDGESMQLSQQDLQDMMDRIQELMEQGRMEEAQRLLDQLGQMMENMRVTQGGEGQPGGEGQQAMEGLAETLREQQGLSDEAFRDLQEQFNPNGQAGQSQGNSGRDGGMGQGQEHQQGQGGQQGEGDGQMPGQQQGQQGENGEPGSAESLADRQQALRDELNRQSQNLPGAGTEAGDAARDALDRAGRAMDGAEEALRGDQLAEAIDRQSEAMEALREGLRNLGEALAEEQAQQQGQQGQAAGDSSGQRQDPLGRNAGSQGQVGTDENLLQGEDVYRRAQDLLDEIRRRSGETERPESEREYLRRLLDRF